MILILIVPLCSVKRQPLARHASIIQVNAAAESEVTEESDSSSEPKLPPKGRGRGRKPKPGPAATMKLDDLAVGQEFTGTIVSVTDFGAFVNIGCDVDGLLHISQISNSFVKNVADAVSIGQELSVRVLNVDGEKKKFSLTAKTAQAQDEASGERGPKPRQARARKEKRERKQVPVKAGDTITGKIASVVPFGIFVEVGEGFQGMLHSSQMKLPEDVDDHLGHFKEGDEVEARVASVIKEKISLTQLSQEEIAAEEEMRTKGLSTGAHLCIRIYANKFLLIFLLCELIN